MTTAVIREWGKIIRFSDSSETDFKVDIPHNILHINHQAWSELAGLIESGDVTSRYLRIVGLDTIAVRNYVGVISTSDGLQIEILPKTDEKPDVTESRDVLWKMLCVEFDLPYLEATPASLRVQENTPIPEMLIAIFLQTLTQVVRRGIRKDYERIEAEEKFLKGQLQLVKQLRQSPGRQHLFHIEYDIFSDNRAENRLIHTALIRVSKWTNELNNQRLARELRMAFDVVPVSNNVQEDFEQWRTSRDMQHYQPLLPWLKLILNEQSPFAIYDQQQGLSFLFPMERLFEKYVAHYLRQKLLKPLYLKEQFGAQYLASVGKKNLFKLKPDLGIFSGKTCLSVLDTKWKLLDANKTYGVENDEPAKQDLKSGISQSDMYQLFAYGHAFLHGKGDLVLIYPSWEKFNHDQPIGPFKFLGGEMTLYVWPFKVGLGQEEDVFHGLQGWVEKV